jgi:hypothetical protein
MPLQSAAIATASSAVNRSTIGSTCSAYGIVGEAAPNLSQRLRAHRQTEKRPAWRTAPHGRLRATRGVRWPAAWPDPRGDGDDRESVTETRRRPMHRAQLGQDPHQQHGQEVHAPRHVPLQPTWRGARRPGRPPRAQLAAGVELAQEAAHRGPRCLDSALHAARRWVSLNKTHQGQVRPA